ncbi:MAG TPA: lytic transglycosylase domain-containing protein [Noviherbaspirillum sp.]|uniref:lytic transglycosylase domain-containing protein n=1 Tax=Noviherbaspirillum sp. TaxID=1926288 RepID=UPI002B49A823|nr:lytic transglycosylase domain-containing protein [Noviherbaspirillum sp.]HJV86249.1 lytic transglycosylase domain-containing protein [Noviherbaspirillum sp.]
MRFSHLDRERDRAGSRRGTAATTGTTIAAAGVALLLCACSSTPDLSPAEAERQAVAATYAASSANARPRHVRTTSRDILREWSTFGIDPLPLKHKRGRTALSLHDVIEEPDYILTIDQIMTNAGCHACDEKPYHQMVLDASARHGVPSSLIHAVIQKESGYNPAATSRRHARGLMQVTPETARFVGVRNTKYLYDPRTNIDVGTAYLKYLIANHTTVDEVLAAYNAGPGNVRKYKGVPPFRETRRYVRDVKKLYTITAK